MDLALMSSLMREDAQRAGIRGGYYHAVTGYSFPQAFKCAWLIGDLIKEAGGGLELAIAEMDHMNMTFMPKRNSCAC